MLQVQSLPSLSHGALAYLESCLQASLLDLLVRLKYTLRRYGKSAATGGASPPAIPYGALLLLLHLHNEPRFYRLASFLGLEEARKKAKESASGASELDMLNDNDDPAADGEHFDDAWLGGGSGGPAASTSGTTGTSSTTDFSPATLPQAFVATNVVSMYSDDVPGMANVPSAEDSPEAILRRKLPPGFLEHLRRLQATDAITINMSPSEYIQYSESRAQAGFTHHKIHSKRFRDFVSPLLNLHDIPTSDELLDILGFLAHEIVFDHIEQGKHAARKRINLLKKTESRSRKVISRDIPEKSSKRLKGKVDVQAHVKKSSSQKRSDLEKKQREEAENRKKELALAEQSRLEEQNRRPDGPFSAPAGSNMTHGMPVPIHCPADIDGPLELPDDPAAEHSKVDGTPAYATIASGYDVLLGDFEEAFHAARRDGWDRVTAAKRRRNFIKMFR